MNTRLIVRVALLVLVVLAVMAGWNAVKNANDGVKLIFFIFVGAGCGLWAIKVVIPRLGEALGTFIYSSGEEIQPDERMKAAAKVAQGDYDGAIREHEKLASANPDDPHPVAEIAKIHSHFFHDPISALEVLEKGLKRHAWPEDAAAFLRFRMADILADEMHDYERAHQVLEQVVADFPNTRHSANAKHRMKDVDQSAYKQVTGHRRNPSDPNHSNPGQSVHD
jgi:tetratricopeptide (TPR) repeat protein